MTRIFGRRVASSWSLLGVGLGFFVAALLVEPSARTDDGSMPLSLFFLIMGACFLGFPLFAAAVAAATRSRKQTRLQALLRHGHRGYAVVLSLDDTGIRINDDPRVRMRLRVSAQGHGSYEIDKTAIVPLIRLPQVQVGSTVDVVIDPTQPNDQRGIELLLK